MSNHTCAKAPQTLFRPADGTQTHSQDQSHAKERSVDHPTSARFSFDGTMAMEKITFQPLKPPQFMALKQKSALANPSQPESFAKVPFRGSGVFELGSVERKAQAWN